MTTINIKQRMKIKVKIHKNQKHGCYKINLLNITKLDLMLMGMLSNIKIISIEHNIPIKIKIQFPQLLGYQ